VLDLVVFIGEAPDQGVVGVVEPFDDLDELALDETHDAHGRSPLVCDCRGQSRLTREASCSMSPNSALLSPNASAISPTACRSASLNLPSALTMATATLTNTWRSHVVSSANAASVGEKLEFASSSNASGQPDSATNSRSSASSRGS